MDPFSHVSQHLCYSPTNLPGPGCDKSALETSLVGCDCLTSCSNHCSHLIHYGEQYLLGKLIVTNDGYHRPVVECNGNCHCEQSRCDNRVVQKGPCPSLKVMKVGNKGWGVIAGVDMTIGDFVCEYAGEIIGETEAKFRSRNEKDGQGNYIMVLKEYSGRNLVQKTIVDPTGDYWKLHYYIYGN